ncbi:MAG: DUF4097 family beta strand repeat-containing protein [Roseburia sp.]
MKKFTKVSLIIAAVFAGLGILLCGIASAMGARSVVIYQALEDTGIVSTENGLEIGITDNWKLWDILRDAGGWKKLVRGNESAAESFDVSEIRNIVIDADMADVTVKPKAGDTIDVAMSYGYLKFFSCEQQGDTLTIKYSSKGNIEEGPDIQIQVPERVELKTMEIDADMSDLSLDDVVFVCEKLKISCDMASVELDRIECGELTVNCSMGSCTLEGSVRGDITAETDMGSVELRLDGAWGDYNYDISCDMGSVSVDGRDYSDFSARKEEKNPGAEATMELDSSMGDITVEFE